MKIVFFNIIFSCCITLLNAQSFPDIKFNHLTETDGLSSNSVTSISQDGNGIIWVATNNGLNRFDGYGFVNFYADLYDTTTINANNINRMYGNQSNHLWIITSAGICDFNTETQISHSLKTTRPSIPAFYIYDGSTIYFDSAASYPYIVSPSGLYHYYGKEKVEEVDNHFPAFTYKGIILSSFAEIVPDKKGYLWAFRQNRIFKINRITKKVEREYASPDPDVSIYDLTFDSQNRCWVTTWQNGMFLFNAAENSWKPFTSGLVNNEIAENGVEWNYNGKKYLVFNTSHASLLFVDEDKPVAFVYRFTESVGNVNPPFVDRQNILWIPTNSGIYYSPSSENLFHIIKINASHGGITDHDPMTTVYNIKEYNGYWIARRYDAGIIWYDKDWKVKQYWPDLVGQFGPAYNQRLATTREGYDFMPYGNKMFITTEWGMVSISMKNFQKQLYQYSNSANIMRLRTIVPENDQKWWIRSFDQGVYIFNPKEEKFIRHYELAKSCEDCKQPEANYLLRDNKGRIFESTNEGLYKYVAAMDSFVRVNPRGNLLLGTSLMGMAVDSSGLLWIGSDNGLMAFNPDSEEVVKVFSENNRIGQVQRITIDKDQNVWFNSLGGYWCWLRQRDKIIQFKYGQGLPYNDGGIFYTTSEGDVLAGGQGAVIRFFPKALMDYNGSAQTKILDVWINNKHALLHTENSNKEVLTLEPDQNNLNILFDVINYNQAGSNLYYYSLSPGQEAWKQVDNGKLSFNNIPPGNYVLSVRGGNKLANGFTNTDTLSFTIKPHWYQSWWFYLVCMLTLGGIILAMVKRRIAIIRKEGDFRTKIAETEMTALRSQMNPHFIFNSLNGIEYFILNNEKRHASIYLNKFARLIRIILSNTRKNVVPFSEDMKTIGLYVDLELLRFNHCFQYVTEIDPQLQDADYLVPPLLIQPFVENAIIHGFAYSEKKNLQLKVTVRLQDDYVIYTIEDNGVGRKESAAYNALNKPGHKSVGMQITRERIYIFNQQRKAEGSVNIEDLYDESGKGSGTRVTVKIKSA